MCTIWNTACPLPYPCQTTTKPKEYPFSNTKSNNPRQNHLQAQKAHTHKGKQPETARRLPHQPTPIRHEGRQRATRQQEPRQTTTTSHTHPTWRETTGNKTPWGTPTLTNTQKQPDTKRLENQGRLRHQRALRLPHILTSTPVLLWNVADNARRKKQTFQLLLHLPGKMNLMIDAYHIWNIFHNARSNRHHSPTWPNIVPATPNKHTTSNRDLLKTGEISLPMGERSETFPKISENEPTQIPQTKRQPAAPQRLLFALARKRFYYKS